MQPWLSWNSLCITGWLWNYKYLLASASQGLGYKLCATIFGFSMWFLFELFFTQSWLFYSLSNLPLENIRSCWWPDFNTLITLYHQQIKFEGIIIKVMWMWMCVYVFAWRSVCLLWGTCEVHGIICSNCFFLFHHMSPKSGALRLGSSHFLTYRTILPAPGLCKLRLIFFNGKTSICFPTLNLQLPRHHMMFKVSQVITSCFFFQLILQVSDYLSWSSICCFFFWCLRKKLEKNPTFSSYCKI